MSYVINREELVRFCTEACEKFGYSHEDAAMTAEVLAETDMMGTHSHGTKNLMGYMKKTEAGGIKANANVAVVRQGPAWALVDGDDAIGMVPSYRAMELAIEKAAVAGIAMVNVRNSTHYGAAGFYAVMAARKGMIGISMSNTDPNMAIPGGKGREIGNSPFSIAFPQKCGDPLFLDIAMSATAALKVLKAMNAGESIPDTWVVDENGFPSTNPGDFLTGGAAQPMAAHKGYGLAMAIEILTGILSGGAILHEIPSWNYDMATPNRVSHCFMAIDISQFIDPSDFADKLEEYTDTIHNSPKRSDSKGILVPGEIECGRYAKAREKGLSLPDDVAETLLELAEVSGVAINMQKAER